MTLWHPDILEPTVSRYLAIADHIESSIETGELQPGEKLPTHRYLADKLGVTIGTVTRGYGEAQRRGVVNAVVGSGTFVTEKTLPDIQFSHLIPSAQDEHLIDLSLNVPIANLPAPGMEVVMEEILNNKARYQEVMLYQQDQGLTRQRKWATAWLRAKGVNCQVENISVTCGGQHGITLALLAATMPGDTIASEGLAYPGIKAAASQRGLKVIGLPMDDQGVIPEAFASQCRLNHLRAIYLSPTIQNPTNASMGRERRQQIVDIAVKNDVWIIEDEVSTNYLTAKYPSLTTLAPNRTFYINSHSKNVAPGLRTGYLVSPPSLQDTVSASIRAQCWFAPALNVELAQRWLDRHVSTEWLNAQAEELNSRQQLLEHLLGQYDINTTEGSFHAWLSLPDPWRAMEFQSALLSKGVKVLSAESFAVGRFPAPEAVRICLSGPRNKAQLEKGLLLIKQQLQSTYNARLSVF